MYVKATLGQIHKQKILFREGTKDNDYYQRLLVFVL